MQSGATTISEYWTVGIRSQCHPMFGAVSKYLYEYILGIRQAKDSVRFERVVIEPKCRKQIREARGYITAPVGMISVEYNEEYIEVFVPEGTKAVLKLDGVECELEPGKSTRVSFK